MDLKEQAINMKIIYILCLTIILAVMITGCTRSKYEVEVTINEDLEDTRTSIDMERIKAWRLEWSINDLHLIGGKYNLDYIFSGFTIPANYAVDWQTIERFAFAYRGNRGAVAIAIDKINDRVYFNPTYPIVRLLKTMPYSANFRSEDLTRLIDVVERANLRNWQESYDGEFDTGFAGITHTFWSMGILFSDGAILRSEGSGDRYFLPPEDEFAILFNFIEALGAEIMQRHRLERAGD